MLKVQVLYRQLDLDRHLGAYDRPRFLTYLDLPRRLSPTSTLAGCAASPANRIAPPGLRGDQHAAARHNRR